MLGAEGLVDSDGLLMEGGLVDGVPGILRFFRVPSKGFFLSSYFSASVTLVLVLVLYLVSFFPPFRYLSRVDLPSS